MSSDPPCSCIRCDAERAVKEAEKRAGKTDCRECKHFEQILILTMPPKDGSRCSHPDRDHPHDPDAYEWCGDWEAR